jgi:hypothetical protein
MAATAASARPDLQVAELRDIRLLQGVTIDGERRAVRVTAKPDAASSGATMEVTVTPEGDDPRPHFRATVGLRDRPQGSASPCPPIPGLASFPMPVEEAYATYLFHGPLFQGIEAIEGMDERGATAAVHPSAPDDCLRGMDAARGGGWVLDPVLVDCALQMQVLWARVHWDVTPLPTQIDGWRCFAQPPSPGAAVRHELRLRPESRSPICTADHWLYGPDGELVATLTGVHGVGSRALNRLASVTA